MTTDKRLMVVSLALLAGCVGGPGSPQAGTSDGVRIAVPVQGSGDATIRWREEELPVRFVGESIHVRAEAHEVIFEGVFGVVWALGETEHVRVQNAVNEYGMAWLVLKPARFDSRES